MNAFLKDRFACSAGRKYARAHGTLERTWEAACKNPRAKAYLYWMVNRTLSSQQRVDVCLRLLWGARLPDGSKLSDDIKHPVAVRALRVAKRYAQGKASAASMYDVGNHLRRLPGLTVLEEGVSNICKKYPYVGWVFDTLMCVGCAVLTEARRTVFQKQLCELRRDILLPMNPFTGNTLKQQEE